MTTRNGRRVTTERDTVTATDFAKAIEKLEGSSESINALVYGDSNVGKTVLAGTCPGRTFWLIGEPGYKSAARMGATGYGRRIPDTATALAAIEWLEERERYKKFEWIVLDGLSTMQDRFRLGYTAEAFDASNGTKRAHRNLPDKPDYFNTQNFLKAWIPRLVDLPVNLLITAHAYRTTETDEGELVVFPGIQGKVNETANSIAGLMDFTGYLEARTVRVKTPKGSRTRVRRRLWFESPPPDQSKRDGVRYICGDKFNVLAPYVDNPTMPVILAKINGEGR